MEMDLKKSAYANYDELELYCYRAASVVGLLTIEILGYQHLETQQYAHQLGLSLQLINILRDVKEDYSRGRVYLPQDELKRFEILPDDFTKTQVNDNMKRLLDYQAQRAMHLYDKAFNFLPETDRYSQRTGIIMAEVYRAVLDKIILSDYQVLAGRVRLASLKKLWIAWEDDGSIRSKVLSKEMKACFYTFTLFEGHKHLSIFRYPAAILQTFFTLAKEIPQILVVQNPSIVLSFFAALALNWGESEINSSRDSNCRSSSIFQRV